MLTAEKNWYPEGVKRCSLSQFLVWLGCISLFVLFGLLAALVILFNGIGVTGLDNYYGFGLWITFDLAVIALGAGAFFTGLLRYIIKIDDLKNIINLSVIKGFCCYSGAMLILTLDIGQPLRAWFGYWHPNVHSMLTEVIFCITCYLTVLIIEYIPLIFEQKQLNKIPFLHHMAHNLHLVMPLFAGLGAFLSTFHQGSLGGMYGVMFARPFAFREGFFIWPWTFFLFVLSAIASGPCMTVLICGFMEKITGRKFTTYRIKSLMAKIGGAMLVIYLLFKLLDTWFWATDTLPRMGFTFDQMYHGLAYGKWLIFSELGLCGVLPAILLMVPAFRMKPSLMYTGCILNALGVVINRYVFTVQTLAIPVLPFDKWTVYYPNWAEWLTSLMIVAYAFIVFSLSYRYLPIFPQEVPLNRGK
ncbi:menaquinone reductase integral membrane subunit QrcD [Desulfovibrio inopinatus]|uniref:menaquinone reductase integral membrane subunit QrcD n=1 Tax=Desulfovibrio inopinatus TaxID=102109 RepID=UPI0004231091|nr:menaquinone reductase integral membrane subunit QrcD [Desulfovibrio inopinatus]